MCRVSLILNFFMPNQLPISENGDKTPKKANDSVDGDKVNGLKSFKSCVKAVKQKNQQKEAALVVEKKEKVPIRVLVNREYEWLATLLERCAFIVFSFLFTILSFGINAVGLRQWQYS
jgi:hypothetical protein